MSSAQEAQQKAPIEALSKEEITNKYKSLLGIAKKAKQAKDELTEENRQLRQALARSETQKEADKKALLTMKEMLEQFTENKLQLSTQLGELQSQRKTDEEVLAQLRIENESLKRQLDRLTEDNDSLLTDIDRMEDQLKQVNLLGVEQKKHLRLLELEVHKLKEAECQNVSLQNHIAVALEEKKALIELEKTTRVELDMLTEKYTKVKEVNAEQRKKFNYLKERFVDVYRKLKKLKECKRVLLETQQEYGEAVTQWQNDIVKASRLLCNHMNLLKNENEELLLKLQAKPDQSAVESNDIFVTNIAKRLKDLHSISVKALQEQLTTSAQLQAAQEENERLKMTIAAGQLPTAEEKELSVATQEKDETHRHIKREFLEKPAVRAEQRHDLAAQLVDLRMNNDELTQRLQDQVTTQQQKLMDVLTVLKLKLRSAEDDRECCQQENLKLQERLRDREVAKGVDVEQMLTEKLRLQSKLAENETLHEDLRQVGAVIENMEKDKLELLQQATVETQKQQQLQQENSNVTVSQNDLDVLQQQHKDLLTRFARKEREHADLLGEMRELNEALKGRGDVISRQQEKQQELQAELKRTSGQLLQLEERLSDKECMLAEKEKQVNTLSSEIDSTRLKVHELEALSAQHDERMRQLTEELHSLRNTDVSTECQSDVLSTSTISHAEELSRMREMDDSFEEKYNKLRGLALKLKKKLQEQNSNMEQMEQQLSGQQKLREELEERQQRIVVLERELSQQQEVAEAVRAELQKSKSSRKQVNMLNLEIEAAEKSLHEATLKLSVKASELQVLNETLATKEDAIVQLRREIGILEAAKEAECTHGKELKLEVDRLQAQLTDTVHSKQNVLLANKELERTCECTRQELEEARLQLAQLSSTQESALSAVSAEKEELAQQLTALKDTLKATQLSLSTAERSLEDLRVEFLDYKVKAQAVLRKNQSKDTTRESELEEELLALRATENQWQTHAQLQVSRIEESDKQINLLRDENDALQRRCKETMLLAEDLRQQNEQLAQDNQNQVRAQQESLRTHRQQLETVDTCHKAQLLELYAQIEKLKEAEQMKALRLPPIVGAPATISPAPTTAPLSSEQAKIDFLLMEREDAEGSEEAVEALAHAAAMRKISNASRRSQHDFMPLDELLNMPMAAISDTVTTITANSHNLMGHSDSGGDSNTNGRDANSNTDKTMLEWQAVKERLHVQESRVRHLTALLAENEQDLAKLTQMNDMLKEELRRQDRSVEREQHMQNSEYLKNVFMKFLTLNSGDERTRLVPVLNTILRLSKEEVETLDCVAKGQKLPTENTRGWSLLAPWSRTD